MKIRSFDFSLDSLWCATPCFSGQASEITAEPKRSELLAELSPSSGSPCSAGCSLHFPTPRSGDAGVRVSWDGLREQDVECWVSVSCSPIPAAQKLGWDMALGSRWGGVWVYLRVSRRESLIALGGWPD